MLVYNLFLSLNISDFSLFLIWKQQQKVNPLFPATHSLTWDPAKPTPCFFKNLVGGSTPPTPSRKSSEQQKLSYHPSHPRKYIPAKTYPIKKVSFIFPSPIKQFFDISLPTADWGGGRIMYITNLKEDSRCQFLQYSKRHNLSKKTTTGCHAPSFFFLTKPVYVFKEKLISWYKFLGFFLILHPVQHICYQNLTIVRVQLWR